MLTSHYSFLRELFDITTKELSENTYISTRTLDSWFNPSGAVKSKETRGRKSKNSAIAKEKKDQILFLEKTILLRNYFTEYFLSRWIPEFLGMIHHGIRHDFDKFPDFIQQVLNRLYDLRNSHDIKNHSKKIFINSDVDPYEFKLFALLEKLNSPADLIKELTNCKELNMDDNYLIPPILVERAAIWTVFSNPSMEKYAKLYKFSTKYYEIDKENSKNIVDNDVKKTVEMKLNFDNRGWSLTPIKTGESILKYYNSSEDHDRYDSKEAYNIYFKKNKDSNASENLTDDKSISLINYPLFVPSKYSILPYSFIVLENKFIYDKFNQKYEFDIPSENKDITAKEFWANDLQYVKQYSKLYYYLTFPILLACDLLLLPEWNRIEK